MLLVCRSVSVFLRVWFVSVLDCCEMLFFMFVIGSIIVFAALALCSCFMLARISAPCSGPIWWHPGRIDPS